MSSDGTLSFVPQLEADGTPFVAITWGSMDGAFTVASARRAALALLEAAEQADLEHDLYNYLLRDVGEDSPNAHANVARVLQSFRAHRTDGAPFTTEGDPQ